jgi:hypothetical protein
MAADTNIKNKIKDLLTELKVAGTLGEVQIDDFKRSILFDRDISAFPVAIISPAAVDSNTETNRDNMRTYEFSILIAQKGENITSDTQIEDLREAILNKFDDNPTLLGNASGGMSPSASRPEPITSADKTYIGFVVTVKAKAFYTRA